MQIILHRGKGTISRLIQWQTRSPYSHASILFSDGTHIEAREFKGVVKHSALTVPDGEFFDRFTIADPLFHFDDSEACVRAFCEAQIGQPYDWRNVFAFVTRTHPKESDSAWFCSELVVAALNAAGLYPFARSEPWEISPGMLARSPLLQNA